MEKEKPSEMENLEWGTIQNKIVNTIQLKLTPQIKLKNTSKEIVRIVGIQICANLVNQSIDDENKLVLVEYGRRR